MAYKNFKFEVDADGNVFAAEGPNSFVQAGGAFTKYSVK